MSPLVMVPSQHIMPARRLDGLAGMRDIIPGGSLTESRVSRGMLEPLPLRLVCHKQYTSLTRQNIFALKVAG